LYLEFVWSLQVGFKGRQGFVVFVHCELNWFFLSPKMPIRLDDVELALLVSLYVVLFHAIGECQPSFAAEDHLMQDSTIGLGSCLHSHDVQVAVSTAALYDYRLSYGLICFNDDLRYWVKPRSTTWFSDFFISLYDDSRWIEQFRMDKEAVVDVCARLRPHIEKQDTKYRQAIPVEVWVCCCLYKLAQGASLLQCSESFAIGKSTVGLLIREVVAAINRVFGNIIRWPRGQEMREVMLEFKKWCGIPLVHGAIDCTHIGISKPTEFPEDYYYFKKGAYSIVAQAVVDCKKQFTNLFVGLPGSVNDSRVLRKSALWEHVMHRRLLHPDSGCLEAVPPFLLADKRYPLLSWLMTPFREDGEDRSVVESLYNRRHRRGRLVVENAFGFMKVNWREMLGKTDLQVHIVPDVFYACCILHNMTIKRRMMLEAENEVRLREQGRWADVAELEHQHAIRLE
jgi:hypothetical protein